MYRLAITKQVLTSYYTFPTGKQMAKTKPALAIVLRLGWCLLREGQKVELRGKSSWTKGIRLSCETITLGRIGNLDTCTLIALISDKARMYQLNRWLISNNWWNIFEYWRTSYVMGTLRGSLSNRASTCNEDKIQHH